MIRSFRYLYRESLIVLGLTGICIDLIAANAVLKTIEYTYTIRICAAAQHSNNCGQRAKCNYNFFFTAISHL